ncbi:MAG TPA: hypothetical protein VKG38_07365 [Solirubrobacteraceae bacterium]|nr:hypothetical protein [Solirubrobacteraceae bacterium]
MSGGGRSARAVTVFGVSALVVYVAALAVTPTNAPNSKSTGVRIAHYAAAHRHHLLAGDLLAALGLALLVLFAAALYRMIRRAEGEDGWLAVGSLASILAGAGIFGVGTVLLTTAAYRPAADPHVLRALWDAGWIAYNSAGFAFAAWIALVAAATLALRVLPAWTAWLGLLAALVNFAGAFALAKGTGAFSPQGSFAFVVGVVTFVWVIAVSLAAWQSGRPAAGAG